MKIIAYDDNPDFGGHQIMAVHGVEALASAPSVDVHLIINPANKRLAAHLRELDIPTSTVRAGFPKPHPDLLLCIQGDISQSTDGLQAARSAGIKCISYLSLSHTMMEMGAKLGALRDRINQRYINLPDRFITISEGMRQKLVTRGCSKPIDVVPNGINVVAAPSLTQRALGHRSTCTLGIAGRIEFKQKQQDFVVNAFKNHPQAFHGCRLLIVGNGPDESELRNMIAGQDNIAFLPWQQDMESFYNQIDLLVIPSRFEGVPLVMLEALARGIPVIGSNRDGMKELLPPGWTFEFNNAESLARSFAHVRNNWNNDIAPLRQRVHAEHSLDAFRNNFRTAVLGQ